MRNLLIFAVAALTIVGCKCPLKEKCCKAAPTVKSAQTNTNYEAQLRQMYKFDTRKISITTEPSGAEIYQVTETEKLKYLGKSPLQDQAVTVLTGISEGLALTGDVMSRLGHFGSVQVMILKEGYYPDRRELATDPNGLVSHNVKLNKK